MYWKRKKSIFTQPEKNPCDVLFRPRIKYKLTAKSRLRDGTEPTVFVPEVAKQHDVLAGAIAFGVLVSARASFLLDKKIRKLFESFHEDLPKRHLFPDSVFWRLIIYKTSDLIV